MATTQAGMEQTLHHPLCLRDSRQRKGFQLRPAQAKEFGANLILFHAYDTLVVAASETSGIRYYDYAAAARAEIHHLEPLAERIRAQGIPCEVVVRPGLAADQILRFSGAPRRPHCDGHPLAGPHRQAAGGFRGRSRPAHRERAGLHRRPRSGRRHTATLRRVRFSAPSA